MNNTLSKEDISSISLEEATTLRRQLSTKIQAIRKQKSLRMEVYIQAEYVDAVETAKDWAFEHSMIPKKTKWGFAKFCIINTTRMIHEQIEKEKAQSQTAVNRQTQPNPYDHTLEQKQPP